MAKYIFQNLKTNGMKYNYKFTMLDREADYVDECHLALSDTKFQCTVHREMDDNSDCYTDA